MKFLLLIAFFVLTAVLAVGGVFQMMESEKKARKNLKR